MDEAVVQAIALFFFFAFLDERRALEASTQAVSYFAAKKKKNPELSTNTLVVMSTLALWSKHHLKVYRGNPNLFTEGGWAVPTGLDLGPWREFQKKATHDELLIVIWSKVLGISDTDIAFGLGISEGTIRYRLAKALRKLGAMAQNVSIQKPTAVK